MERECCALLRYISCVQLCVTPWIVACQDPLSMGFSRQEYWSGVPFPSPGDLSNTGIQSTPLTSQALAGGIFTTSTTWRAPKDALLASQGKEGLLRNLGKKKKKKGEKVFHLKTIMEGMAEQTAFKTCFTYTYRMTV